MIEEDRLIAEVTGNPPVAFAEIVLAAWRGQQEQASTLIEAALQEPPARSLSAMATFASYASSVLDNGLGRHDAARDAALAGIHARSTGVRVRCRARTG